MRKIILLAAGLVLLSFPVSAGLPEDVPEQCTRLYDRLNKWEGLTESLKKYDLEKELIYALIAVESGCSQSARSPANAQGLMQVKPETALQVGVRSIGTVESNITAGVKHLAGLRDRFNGNIKLALAAYRKGEKAVDESDADGDEFVERVLATAGRLKERGAGRTE